MGYREMPTQTEVRRNERTISDVRKKSLAPVNAVQINELILSHSSVNRSGSAEPSVDR